MFKFETQNDTNHHTATRSVHAGTMRSDFGETSEALFLTQGFVYDSAQQAEARFKNEAPGFIYSRYDNPTVTMFEARMCAIEGANGAVAMASGMAAVNASFMAVLKAGDHVVAARALFGSCLYIIEELLPRMGVEITLIDGCDLEAWQAAVRSNTKMAFLESPTNPTLDVLDIPAIAEIVHKAGARLVVDNVFASPVLQSPLRLGADVVVYSATKHIDGQGRCLGGIVLSNDMDYIDAVHTYLKHAGAALSPFNAWVLLKGLETLSLRIHRQTQTATTIANWLAEQKQIIRLIYPGRSDHPHYEKAQKQMRAGSTLICFECFGDKTGAFRLLNALKVIRISNNLGDAKSLITHPSTTTHQRLEEDMRLTLGITQGTLRLSVGLEEPEDLIDDLTKALEAI